MEKENGKKENSFMIRLSTLIVDKRKGFYLVFIMLILFSVFSMNRVQVNNDLTSYLPDTTETRQGLDLMEKQFVTYGTARIMVCNVTLEEARQLAERLEAMDGVSMLDFDDSLEHYHDMEALFSVTFDGEADDEASLEHLNGMLEFLSDYDVYYTSDIGQEERDASDLDNDMIIILLLAGVVIVSVLLFTSTTYAEIPVFLMTFIVAAILNKGTNYWFGTISFVTDSIAVVLQLALAVDYAIILCHRFMEEHEDKDAREAVIVALSKAIPEISSSSLTTVSGMVALMFMQFRIGYDMGIVLAKAIVMSLVSVFFLMPGLLLTFARAIDHSHHKSFVPKITAVGKFCVHTRFIIPPLFILVVIAAAVLSGRTNYVYDMNTLESKSMSANRFSVSMVNREFGKINQLAVMVPRGDYEKEGQALRALEAMEEVDSVMGLANIEAMDGYILTQQLTPREFSELVDLDVEVADLLYTAYAVGDSNYGALVSGVSQYKVPLIDMFLFIYDQKEKGNITLEDELEETLSDAYSQISIARDQLQGEDYSRFVLELSVPAEGQETYDALERVRDQVARFYDREQILLAGNSTSNKDLSDSFGMDNTIITVLTALFVMIILLFTFQSAGLPVLLVLTIQGSIWMNFSLPYLLNEPVFFLGYLVVSAIQMGATIDYAIVITSRYMELKVYMSIKEAIVETLNQAFPTIVTSGSMLVAAGFIISNVSSNAVVAAIGLALGRGTLTSIALVLLVLPQTLLIGDIIIEKTAFTLKRDMTKPLPTGGRIRMSGHIKGFVNGVIEGEFTGVIDGEMGAVVRARDTVESLDQFRQEETAVPVLETKMEEGGLKDKEETQETSEDITEAEKTHEEAAKSVKKLYSVLIFLCAAGLLSRPIPVQAAEGQTYGQYIAGSEAEGIPQEESGYTLICISTEQELAQLAENCKLDSWSRDKYVKLEADIILQEYRSISIPSFGGIFDGGGHRIQGLELTAPGSRTGLFRYIQESGTVKNLQVEGRVSPEGSGSQAGILAGVNYGRIWNCEVSGSISGKDEIGGLAGINQETGEIRQCKSNALVTGVHYTGGICGVNRGIINNCSNGGAVNTNSEEVLYDLEDLTMERLEDLNSVSNVAVHTDTGGIAGYSEGKIYYCSNSGTVGYQHVGYNVGGIAGRLHQGYVQSCTNSGHVLGRKDVGGIAGQMEPFLEIEYLNDKLDEIDRESEKLIGLLEETHSDLNHYGSQAASFSKAVTASLNRVSQASGSLISTVHELWYIYNQELTGVTNDLRRLNTELEEQSKADQNSGNQGQADPLDIEEGDLPLKDLTVSGGDVLGGLDPGDITIKAPDNLEGYLAALRRFGDSAGTHLTNTTNAFRDRNDTITNNLNVLDEGLQSACRDMDQLAEVLEKGTGQVGEDTDAVIAQIKVLRKSMNELRDDLFRYEGISIEDTSDEAAGGDMDHLGAEQEVYYDTSSFQQGKVTLCINQGRVEADTNVGGIVGQISTELDFDPEDDVDITGERSFNIEQTVKAVVRESRNLGNVTGKKDHAGGIVGKADYGAIISCESYGNVASTDGSYVGGIAGSSRYCVRSCYFLGSLSGENYVGGIVGRGSDILYSYSNPSIELTGECAGAVAGMLEEEGFLYGNYYVEGSLPGVDFIGYAGGAQPLSYEEFCSREGVPAAFREFQVVFSVEGQELASFTCGYGDSLDESLIPRIPEKEGFYGVWPEFDYGFITGSRVLEAQYEPWISSLDSQEKNAEGRPCVLVQGQFLPGARLVLTDRQEGTGIAVVYETAESNSTENQTADNQSNGQAGEYNGLLMVRVFSQDPENTLVEIFEDGIYKSAETSVIGSYLEFSMEGNGIFRLTAVSDDSKLEVFMIIGGAGAAIIIVLIAVKLCRKHSKKKSQEAGPAQREKERP